MDNNWKNEGTKVSAQHDNTGAAVAVVTLATPTTHHFSLGVSFLAPLPVKCCLRDAAVDNIGAKAPAKEHSPLDC